MPNSGTWDEPTEHTHLRQAVRSVAEPYGYRYFDETARAGRNPTELWHALGAGGFLGVNIPEEYGGGGKGVSELAVVTEEVAAAGTPLMLLALSPAVCASILVQHGTASQRSSWLPGLATGEHVMAFAITEPDAGSNTYRTRTTATRDGDDWVLQGTKYYVSHVDNADAILVVTRTSTDSHTGKAGLTLFLVPVDAPGLERSAIDVEIRSPERQYTLHFDQVRVPAEAVIGDVDGGLRAVFAGLNPERIGTAAIVNGIARYALDKGARYAREREVWDVPIGAHQAVAHPLARAHIQTELARLATRHAARSFDAGGDVRGEHANIAKFAATEACAAALDAAIQSHGGNGLAAEYGLGGLLGLVRLFRIAPVSSEMALNHVAQHGLGLPRSY